jgi:hypothetical protein
MNHPLKSREVVTLLAITYAQLTAAIHNGKLVPPEKDVSGDYRWLPADVERARKAIFTDRRLKANRVSTRKRVPA